MRQTYTNGELEQAVELVREHGGIRKASRESGIPYATLHGRYQAAMNRQPEAAAEVEPLIHGRIHTRPREQWPLPPQGKVSRYIFTCAQNNTALNEQAWDNLVALAKHYKARLCVSTFTYNKAAYGKKAVKRGKTASEADVGALWYDPEIEPFVVDKSVVVAPGLIWCGEMNILPSAVRPLSGFESYTGRFSGIFPHVKIAMESVASGKFEGVKFNYTTGTVTQRNYIAKKEGLKAEFHHSYGGLLVEVNSNGDWWCRQVVCDGDGVMYDLELQVFEGKVEWGHRVEAITWGDIHVGSIDRKVMAAQWTDNDSMIKRLRPKYQFMHDVLDFRSRNPHEIGNPHKRFELFVQGRDDVLEEVKAMCRFLGDTSFRHDCMTVIVDSNHDNMLTRWLREADYRADPKNALFFLDAQKAVYQNIAAGNRNFHLLEYVWGNLGWPLTGVRFLRPDESFIICRQANGGIECGMHGHLGPDGARGSRSAFARMGRKSNTGHTHRAGITDGAYSAGITGSLDQGYNTGPSSWSNSSIVTYPNGKRAIITIWNGGWCA